MVNENAPAHLQTLKPKMHSEIHGASTRNATSKTLDKPKVRLQATQNSFLPRTVSLWNKMPKELQNTSSIVLFKLGYKKRHLVVPDKNIQKIRCFGTKCENTKHARLRMEWSCLNSTLNKFGITDSKNCNNCSKPGTTSHYLFNTSVVQLSCYTSYTSHAETIHACHMWPYKVQITSAHVCLALLCLCGLFSVWLLVLCSLTSESRLCPSY